MWPRPTTPTTTTTGESTAKSKKSNTEREKDRSDDQAAIRLLSVFTDGLADERLDKAGDVLNDDKLTVDEKLWKIDALIPIPPTVSAERLGKALGGRRQGVFISSTISGGQDALNIEHSIVASMRRLRTDRIDIVFLRDTLFRGDDYRDQQFAELERLRSRK